MKKKVQKMLSPEEQTALSNIQSILSELLSMSSNGAEATPTEEPPVEMAEGEDMMTPEEEETEGKEVKMIIKGMETTPSDAATASDDAEQRMDEVQTEQTEENVNEVAKALLKLLKPQTVKKAKQIDPTTVALNQIVQVIKSQNERQSVLEETLGHVLSSMGVMKQLEVAKAEQKKKQPIVDNDNSAVLKAILSELQGGKVQKDEYESYVSNSQRVKKNLGSAEVLKGLLGK